ncbi:MAG TPA: hypothetical protein VMX94_06180 [Armatimonadota bacterium]|nr:hypothetical protein [Armatimonadota bacterium]
MALIEPAVYHIGFRGDKLTADAPPQTERGCKLRFIGGAFISAKGYWTFAPGTTCQAAQLLEILPHATMDSRVGRMANDYWRNVAEGRATHYGEIGYAVSPMDLHRGLSIDDYRKKYGNRIIDWIQEHGGGVE